jgi:hypothetical protein
MKNIFLKWWLQNTVVLVGCGFAVYSGWAKELVMKDSSYLCIVIFALYLIFSLLNGWVAYKVDSGNKVKSDALESTWFVSEVCLALGMIGTVIGFISMLSNFAQFEEGGKAIQKLLSGMSAGMGTALYTTLVGLIFGNILKMQAFQIERVIESTSCRKHKETTDQAQAS